MYRQHQALSEILLFQGDSCLISHLSKDLVCDLCLSTPKISDMETKPHRLPLTVFELSDFLKEGVKLALTLINYYYTFIKQLKIGFEYVVRESYRNLLSRVKLADLISTFTTLQGATYSDTIPWNSFTKILCIHSYLYCRIISGELYFHFHKIGNIIHKAVK